jgi:uncharacterized membrane protein
LSSATAVVIAAVNFDSSVKFLHVLLAIVAVGVNASYGIWLAGSDDDAEALRGIKRLHDHVAIPAYVLLGVTGVVLVVRGPWDITTPWIAVSSVLYLVGLAGAVFASSPALLGQLIILEEHGPQHPVYRAATRYTTIAAGVTGALAVVIIFLMVTKPG